MKGYTITLFCLAATFGRADIITQWNFNADSLNPTIGVGTVTNIGGTSSFFGFGSGSSDPAGTNRAWGVSNLPVQGTASGTAGIQGAVSTLGYEHVHVVLDIKNQFSSSKYYDVRYRTTGVGAFQPSITFSIGHEDVWENHKIFDVSASNPHVNMNALFEFQIVAVFKPGTNEYAGMTNTSASYGRFGTLNDMLTVEGTPVPEPASIAILTLGAGAILIRRRRVR